MKLKTTILLIASSCAAVMPLSAATVFSNNFEDGNFAPDTGTWTFTSTPTVSGVIPNAVAGDPTLGNNVGLIDQGGPLALALNLTNTVSLTGGNTVTIDFDVAARRTSGNTKTIFVDAKDSFGNIVTRFVLGDAGAFGNANADRQRPGYDPTSAGAANTANSVLPAPSTPGSFWWGADGNTATFDVLRDAHMSLTISASTFDVSTTSQAGVNYSSAGIGNRDGGTFADIASVEFSSAGANYGIYIDNLVVAGTVIPEPSSALLLGLAGLGILIRRKR